MNYVRVYKEFIVDRKSKHPSTKRERGRELHHIEPRCLGGKDVIENLISLTASDHLFAHLLLAKIYGGKLSIAFRRMYFIDRYKGRHTRNAYQVVMDEAKKAQGNSMRGKKHSPRQTEALRKQNASRRGKPMHPNAYVAMAKVWKSRIGTKAHPNSLAAISRKGNERSEAQKARDKRASDALRGRPHTPAQVAAIKRIADERRGKPWPAARRAAEEAKKLRRIQGENT